MKIEQYIQRSLLLAIGSGYDTIWRDLNAKLRKEDCNFLQAVMLIAIFFESGRMVTPTMLAAHFRTTRGNVSHCLSHLEKRGFIRRALSPDDARSYRLVLRPEGERAALRFIKIIDHLESFFELRFGKEKVLRTIESIAEFEAAYRTV